MVENLETESIEQVTGNFSLLSLSFLLLMILLLACPVDFCEYLYAFEIVSARMALVVAVLHLLLR